MIIYNKQGLDNVALQEEAEQAFHLKCISKEELSAIKTTYPTGFYTPPHFALRAGIFILTLVILQFGLALLGLIMLSGIEKMIEGLVIFAGILTYVLMELLVNSNKHYRSGADDALLWMSVSLIVGGIAAALHLSPLGICFVAFLFTAAAVLRTTDAVMAICGQLAFMGILFFGMLKLGTIGNSLLPFVLMIASIVFYFIWRRISNDKATYYYRHIFPLLLTLSLLSFYVAGNYLAVSMANNMLSEGEEKPIALGWLFWSFTTLVPLAYIYFGIKNKDAVLLRTGLILVAAAIFTIRYYHSVLPLEWAMTLGGILLTGGAYLLIRYLKTPKYGFSDEPEQDASRFGKLQLEALLVAQTMQQPAQGSGNQFDFGGGSGGGGGAGGTF